LGLQFGCLVGEVTVEDVTVGGRDHAPRQCGLVIAETVQHCGEPSPTAA
jgi:hypothetical protein